MTSRLSHSPSWNLQRFQHSPPLYFPQKFAAVHIYNIYIYTIYILYIHVKKRFASSNSRHMTKKTVQLRQQNVWFYRANKNLLLSQPKFGWSTKLLCLVQKNFCYPNHNLFGAIKHLIPIQPTTISCCSNQIMVWNIKILWNNSKFLLAG